jgi:hypothetical protein
VGLVGRVTKTTIYLKGGIRISKTTLRDQSGWAWYPPTQGIVRQFEDFEAARVAYEAMVVKFQEAVKRATTTQLRYLTVQMESAIEQSGLK